MAPVVTPWARSREGRERAADSASDSIVAVPNTQRGLFISHDPGLEKGATPNECGDPAWSGVDRAGKAPGRRSRAQSAPRARKQRIRHELPTTAVRWGAARKAGAARTNVERGWSE